MTKRTVFVSLFCAVTMAASAGAVAAEDIKIGTVDMQKALQTVEAGKKAKSDLEKEFNAKKKELQSEEAAIKKMGEEFKKQSLVKKQGEIQERIMRFQETTARSQAEIQQKEQQLTEPIISKLRHIVADLAKAKGYTIVLEKNENMVLFSQEKDDLTEQIVTTFNKDKGKS